MLDALQDGRMSIRPGALNQQLGPTSAPAPSMGPAATGARGISGGRGISSGPGAAFAKGGISSGPGANRGGVVSAGPGAAFLAKKKEEEGKDVTIKMAEYTPDGRKIIATGPPCAKCGQMVLGKITNVSLNRLTTPFTSKLTLGTGGREDLASGALYVLGLRPAIQGWPILGTRGQALL